jgi:hypothetical protein
VEITEADGVNIDLRLLDELTQYLDQESSDPPFDEGGGGDFVHKPLPVEQMDFNGDGTLTADMEMTTPSPRMNKSSGLDFYINGVDIFDLTIAADAYWSGEKVGEDAKVWRYYHKDHLGGNTVITDSNGDVVSTLRYHPYGKIAQRTMRDQLV